MIVAALLAVLIPVAGALMVANGRRQTIVDAAILGPGAGFGVLSVVFFVWRFAFGGSGDGFAAIAWLLVVGAVAAGVVRWIAAGSAGARPYGWRRPPAVLLATAGFVLVVAVFSGWLLTRRQPLGSFDAWAIWSSRARLLYASLDLPTVFATLREAHPDYPLFLPGTLAAQFSMVGGISEWVPVWTGVVFLVATTAAVALGVRRLGACSEVAGVAALVLLATPLFTAWGFAQGADMPLAYLLTLASLGLALLTVETRAAPFSAGTVGFLTGLMAWTKNEGMILSLLLLGLYALFAVRSKPARNRLPVIVLTAAIPAAATVTFKLGWDPHSDLPAFFASPLSNALSIERWRFVGVSFWERFDPLGGFADWGLVWTVAAAALLLGMRVRAWRVQPLAFLFLASMACWALWFGIFIATPVDIAWHVSTALDRLMLQLLPLTLMTGFASLPMALGDTRGPPREAAADEDPQGPSVSAPGERAVRTRGEVLRALLVVVAFACSACATAPPQAVAPSRTPLLLIAVDGLEWSVLLPLLKAGELPTFRAWLDNGRGGYLETMRPTKSPVVWTTVATGKSPERHGITDFIRRDDDGEPSLFTARDRRSAALWNMTSALELPTAVVGWWMTWPVEPVHGVMVAQTNMLPSTGPSGGAWKGSVLEDTPDQVWPPERTGEVVDVLREAEERFDETTRSVFGDVPLDMSRSEAALWHATRWSLRADAVYLRMARRLLAEDRFGLAMLYLGGADVVGHRYWRYHRPSEFGHPPGEAERRRFGDFVTSYYRYLDRELGELTADLEDWNIVMISDHGMVAQHTDATFDDSEGLGEMTSGHHLQAPPGVLIATGPQIRRGAPAPWVPPSSTDSLPVVGSVMDITPTALALLGLPIADDMEGGILHDLLALDGVRLPKPVASYDDFALPDRGDALARSRAEEERLEQLRALGYIGRE